MDLIKKTISYSIHRINRASNTNTLVKQKPDDNGNYDSAQNSNTIRNEKKKQVFIFIYLIKSAENSQQPARIRSFTIVYFVFAMLETLHGGLHTSSEIFPFKFDFTAMRVRVCLSRCFFSNGFFSH